MLWAGTGFDHGLDLGDHVLTHRQSQSHSIRSAPAQVWRAPPSQFSLLVFPQSSQRLLHESTRILVIGAAQLRAFGVTKGKGPYDFLSAISIIYFLLPFGLSNSPECHYSRAMLACVFLCAITIESLNFSGFSPRPAYLSVLCS